MKLEALEELKQKGEIDEKASNKLCRVIHTYPNSRAPLELWTISQKKAFRDAVFKFGRDWKAVSGYVGSKSI